MKFQAIDLEERPWVPYSGWPFRPEDLEPWYESAARWLGLSRREPDLSDLANLEQDFTVHHSNFCPEPDFSASRFRELRKRSNVQVLSGFRVVELCRRHDSVVHIRAIDEAGRSRLISGRAFVLCSGAIENARLLLQPTKSCPQGIGNQHGLVGRFFQDHPNGPVATVEAVDPLDVRKRLSVRGSGSRRYLPKLALPAPVQRQLGLLNAAAVLAFEYDEGSLTRSLREVNEAVAGRRYDKAAIGGFRALARHPFSLARAARDRVVGRPPGRSPAASRYLPSWRTDRTQRADCVSMGDKMLRCSKTRSGLEGRGLGTADPPRAAPARRLGFPANRPRCPEV